MATGKCGVFKRLSFDASRREFDHVQKGNSSLNGTRLSRCHDYVLNRKDELVSPLDGPCWVPKELEGLQMPPNKKQKYSPIIWDREGEDMRPSLKKTAARKSPPKSPSSSLTDEDLGGLVSKRSIPLNQVDEFGTLSVHSDEVGGESALEFSTKQPSPWPQKQSAEDEQESSTVEDGEFVQERNISMSRWASDSDSPSYSYASDDEETDRYGTKSDSRRSGSESGELLTGSSGQVVGSGSVERDSNLSVSGEHCTDDLEGGNFDAMDVERNCTSDTDNGCNDMAQGDDDDACQELEEEPAGPPRRSVNMLCSCRNVFDYEKLNKINEGAYGVVYRARDKKTGEIVALKKVKMNVGDREGFPMSSLREINILLSFDHPSVVGVKEVVMDDRDLDSVFMVMEYMEHDLKTLMERRKRPFSIGEVKCLMLQLLEGVKYLHDNWVLHRDLKTSNLLFNNTGELKICDFGLSRQYGSPLKPYTPLVVTLWYRAPELLLGAKEYSSAIDMWSVGCIMAELLGNEPLFKGNNEVNQLDKIFRTLGTPNKKIWPGFSELPGAKANFVNQPYNLLRKKFPVSPFMGSMCLSESGLDLLNRLLTYDPEKRITADEALDHEWFHEVPFPSSRDFMPTFPPQHAMGR